ncbi:hypothetical protein RB595_007444 [Gaeumannomyces hyphopodioides]
MDLAKTLVRSVVRAFYETKHALVIDALVLHSALRDDDLAYLMNMNTKDLHKLCGRLREDRFIQVQTRPELKEGSQRPVNRMYYYIDYRQAIDAIKWRVYKIDKEMQGVTVPVNERKEYFCERAGCMKEYSSMEVLDNPSSRGFLCQVCSSVLRHDPEGKTGGHKQSTRMNTQFRFITDLLPRIDNVIVPDNNFEIAIQQARPVERDALHQVVSSVAVEVNHRPGAVKGLTNLGPKSVTVNLTAGGPSAEELEAERLRKEEHALRNALPSWIAESTVTGDAYELDPAKRGIIAPAAAAAGSAADAKNNNDDDDTKDHAEIDDLFAKLKREQEAEAARLAALEEEDEDDEEEEDDDDMFEDVVTGTNNSAGGTPASTAPNGLGAPAAAAVAPSPLGKSSLKRDASSGPASGTTSPHGLGTPGSDGRPVKRVKVEVLSPPPAAAAGEESDDDIEFEDV